MIDYWQKCIAFACVPILCVAGTFWAGDSQNGRGGPPSRASALLEHPGHASLPVDGVVLVVRKDLVEISIGSDDGLRKGHRLDVYRESTYLGRVAVRRTAPDRAVAEIIPAFHKGQIRKGDVVRTVNHIPGPSESDRRSRS